MTIEIPSDRYFTGYHVKTNWTDSDETVGTSGQTISVALPDDGVEWGIGFFGNPIDSSLYGVMVYFNTVDGDAMSYGGNVSSVAHPMKLTQYSADLGDTALSSGIFGGTITSGIYLKNVFIDAGTNNISIEFDIASGSTTLSAEADFYLFKGGVIT